MCAELLCCPDTIQVKVRGGFYLLLQSWCAWWLFANYPLGLLLASTFCLVPVQAFESSHGKGDHQGEGSLEEEVRRWAVLSWITSLLCLA